MHITFLLTSGLLVCIEVWAQSKRASIQWSPWKVNCSSLSWCSLFLSFIIIIKATGVGLQGGQSCGGPTAATTGGPGNLFHNRLNVTTVSVGTTSLHDGHLLYLQQCLWPVRSFWHRVWQDWQGWWVLETVVCGTATRPALVWVWWLRRHSGPKKTEWHYLHGTEAGPWAAAKSSQLVWWQHWHFRLGHLWCLKSLLLKPFSHSKQ